jgi:flavin-dependent dehydrogenase
VNVRTSPLDRIGPEYDAVIVGARAAGAATALLLARRGRRVLVVDRGVYGSDTLSTHALMRAGVQQLARFGLLGRIEVSGAPLVSRTVFHYEDEIVDVPIAPRGSVPGLFAPRRTVLDRTLVDGAVHAGAEVRYRLRLAELSVGASGRVEGVVLADEDGAERTVRAGLVIGADGLRSAVAARVGAPVTRWGQHATATIYGYWSGLEVEGYHWHWSPGAAAGAIPTNDGEVLLFASMPPRRFAQEAASDIAGTYRRVLFESAPDLARRIDHARLTGPLRGFAGHPGYFRRPFGPGWALVGDAGYFKDPITAHGLSDALRDAELLAIALDEAEGGDEALARYESVRDGLSARLFEITDRVASLEWDNREVKALHRALSDEMKREVREMSAIHEARPEPVEATA